MKKVFFTFLLLLVVLFGCSKDNNESQQDVSSPALDFIEVTIQTPEKININEAINIQALVTQGNDKVDDADEVKFELWEVGHDEHEELEAHNDGNGLYSMEKTFKENGQYIVVAHVTARSMHSMPKKEFTVGNPEEAEATEEHSHEAEPETEHNSAHEGDHGHHESSLEIEFNQDNNFTVNQEVNLKTTLKHENAPLVGAKVRFEIIPGDESKKEWVDAKEDAAGVYSAPTTFKGTGEYHVQIHVNKADIHEHKIVMFEVK